MTHKRKHKFRKSVRGTDAPIQESIAPQEVERSQMPLLVDEASAADDLATVDEVAAGGTVPEHAADGNAGAEDAIDDAAPARVESREDAVEAIADAAATPPAEHEIRFRREDMDTGEASFGATLREAREQRGWSQIDVGARLKLPIRLIERIENDDYAGMTQGVYLRGYLTSYARLLDLPVERAERIAEQHVEPVPLVATGTTSHSRYLFDRYSVSATYLILTALIVAPAVWLATHGGLEQNLARNLPLDGALVALDESLSDTTSATAAESGVATDAEVARRTIAVDPPPIISSIAPFPAMHASAPTKQEIGAQPVSAPAAASADHSLTLRLSEESWVEVLDADGERVEYGLLPAGTERSYAASGPLSVHLGNAGGATVLADGKVVELEPFRRANVVRLTVFDDRTADTPVVR
jgi:cytoskeleton protein RodZ